MKESTTVLVKDRTRYSNKSKFIEYELKDFRGVGQFKSIARAIRKGYVTPQGIVAPRRPFNNRKDKSRSGCGYNTLKRQIYGELVGRPQL